MVSLHFSVYYCDVSFMFFSGFFAKRKMLGFRLYVVIGRSAVCSSVGVLPRDEARCENLISMPWSRKPSCWIRQTWLLAQQIDSLNSSAEPNSALLRFLGGLVLCVICLSPTVTD